MILYHATAIQNLVNIQRHGLLISQRGINPYGLDSGINYFEIYTTQEEVEQNNKPNAIHLTRHYEKAVEYGKWISQLYHVAIVILEIDLANKVTLFNDPEDSQGYYVKSNIPPTSFSIRGCLFHRSFFTATKNNPIQDSPSKVRPLKIKLR